MKLPAGTAPPEGRPSAAMPAEAVAKATPIETPAPALTPPAGTPGALLQVPLATAPSPLRLRNRQKPRAELAPARVAPTTAGAPQETVAAKPAAWYLRRRATTEAAGAGGGAPDLLGATRVGGPGGAGVGPGAGTPPPAPTIDTSSTEGLLQSLGDRAGQFFWPSCDHGRSGYPSDPSARENRSGGQFPGGGTTYRPATTAEARGRAY